MPRVFFMRSWRTAAAMLVGAGLLAGCASAPETEPSGLPVTSAHSALFPGYYHQALPGGVEVDLTIGPDLSYEFDQPLAANKIKRIKGFLEITGDRTAKAGRVKLEWSGRNMLNVKSPYGTSMETGSSAGAAQGIMGAEFNLRRQ